MDLAVIRIYGSMAIILGCFIFLYPKLMHPLVMTLFGMNTKNTEPRNPDGHDLPPYLRDKARMAESKSAGVKDDIPDHIRRMRSGPHPGMRAAAAEQSRQQTKGSGKGMMGVILPMYAVGIVVYLVYTLFKVFNKKDDKDKSRRSPSRSINRSRDEYEEMGDNSQDEGRVSQRKKEMVTPQDLQNELQSLVSKVQDKNLTEMDMRKLQERLAETEAQMTKILAAMQAVQGKVDVAAKSSQGQGQTGSQDTSNNQSSESTQKINEETVKKKEELSTESSPASSESYEIINNPGKADSNTIIETVQSKTTGDNDGNDSSQLQDLDDETNDENDEEEEDSEADTEDVEEVMMEDRQKDEEKNVTVRQRVTKKEDTDS